MINPWKDIAPYKTSDAANFRGRDEDIRKFSKIIRQSNFSVLYAESGIGKTSFINAGIIPDFIDTDYYFIRIEFPLEVLASTNDEANEVLITNLEKWLCHKIFPEVPNENNLIIGEQSQELSEITATLSELEHNLWWRLHTYQYKVLGKKVKPFIVFDQFEEVFQKANPNLLQELFAILDSLSSRIPPRVVLDGLSELEEKGIYVSLNSSIDFKVLFSLRKEYLAEFDYWTNDVYSNTELLQSRMILLPFTKAQAEEVITQQKIGEEQITTLTDIKDDILNLFEQRTTDFNVNIRNKYSYEAFLLSVVCSRLYTIAISLHKKRLAKEDMTNINLRELILKFYIESIGDLIPKRHLKIIEEELVDKLGERNRIKLTTDNLTAIKFQERYLAELKKRHVVKSSDGYVELIHDRLAEAIFYKRKESNKKQWFLLQRIILSCLILCFTGLAFYLSWSTSVKTSYLSREILKKEELKIPFDQPNVNNESFVKSIITDNDKHDTIYVQNCSNLTSIKVNGHNPHSLYFDIKKCPMLETLSISDSITELTGEIKACPNLHYIRLPQNINNISPYTFAKTGSNLGLDSIEFEIPESAKDKFVWENKILWDLKRREIVYIQKGADSLVLFPKELEHLDSINAAYPYKKVIRNAKNKEPQIVIDGNTIIKVNMYNNTVIDFSDSIYNNIESIRRRAFFNCKNLQEIILPRNLKSIEDEAFYGCKSLRNIKFPSSLRSIEDAAFSGCTNLTEIILPNSLKDLNRYAFSNCSRLKKVHLPDSLDISQFIICTQFDGCDSLNNFTFSDRSLFYEKDGIIFCKNNPCFFVKENIIYNDSSIKTKDGILTYTWETVDLTSERQSIKVNVSQDIHVPSQKHHVSYRHLGFGGINESPIVHNPDSVEYLPVFTEKVSFIGVHKLRELHIANTSPREIYILLPNSLKSGITLYVPYGCKKYFNDSEYTAFKEIKEDPWYLRVKNILHEMLIMSLSQSKVTYIICTTIILVVFIFIYLFYKKRYIKEHSRDEINNFVLNCKGLSVAFSTLVVFLLTWMSIYWTIFFYFEDFFAMIIGHGIGIIGGLFAVWVLVYVRNADILMATKRGIHLLKAQFKALTFTDVKRYLTRLLKKVSLYIQITIRWIKNSPKICLSFLICCIFIGGFFHQKNSWDESIEKAKLMISKDLNKDNIIKADSLLYSSMPRWEFLLSERQKNDLMVIYDKIAPNVSNTKVINELGYNKYGISSGSFSHNDSMIVTCLGAIWNTMTGDRVRTLHGHRFINSVSFSHNDSMIVTDSRDKTILWNAMTGDSIRTLRRYKDYGNATISFSHNDSMVVRVSRSEAVIWNTMTGDSIYTLGGHQYYINSVSFSHNDNMVVTGSMNKAIIWNAISGDEIYSWSTTDAFWSIGDMVEFVSFISEDEVMIGLRDNLVKLSNLGKEVRIDVLEFQLKSSIKQISPDLRLVMDTDNNVYDMENGMLLHTIHCQDNEQIYFATDKNEYYIVSDGYVRKVRLMSLSEWMENIHKTLIKD